MDEIPNAIPARRAMNTIWTEIKTKKRDFRRILADLPLRAKLEKLNAMRERQDRLRTFKPVQEARFQPFNQQAQIQKPL